MKITFKTIVILATLTALFSCTPEENNTDQQGVEKCCGDDFDPIRD